MADNGFGNAGATAFAEALKTNNTLHTLNLECTWGGGNSWFLVKVPGVGGRWVNEIA